MKELFRYIRYRICRTIYYADHCPMDNRRNYKKIAEDLLAAFGLCLSGLVIMILFCFLGF